MEAKRRIQMHNFGKIFAAPQINFYVFSCNYCNSNFKQISGFLQHLKQDHTSIVNEQQFIKPNATCALNSMDLSKNSVEKMSCNKTLSKHTAAEEVLPELEQKNTVHESADVVYSNSSQDDMPTIKTEPLESLENQHESMNAQRNLEFAKFLIDIEKELSDATNFPNTKLNENMVDVKAEQQVETLSNQKKSAHNTEDDLQEVIFEISKEEIEKIKEEEIYLNESKKPLEQYPQEVFNSSSESENSAGSNFNCRDKNTNKPLKEQKKLSLRHLQSVDHLKTTIKSSRTSKMCGRTSDTPQHLMRQDDRITQRLTQYKCNCCDHIVITKAHLRQHILLNHTSFRKYTCSYCTYTSRRKEYLKIHMKQHARALPFNCDICNMTFVFYKSMERHRKMHFGCNIV